MLMKLLMIDHCITQRGSQGGGGQVWLHCLEKNKEINKGKQREQRAAWELRERGTVKVPEDTRSTCWGNARRRSGERTRTPTQRGYGRAHTSTHPRKPHHRPNPPREG